nr:hypothetical protein [Tanacetum cinerariifolium]
MRKKMKFVKQPTRPALDHETAKLDTIDKYYETVNLEKKAKQERFEIVKAFHACKQEEGQEMIAELHAMLKLHEKSIPKKAKIFAVLATREGKIQKDKKKPKGAKAKDSVCHQCKEVGHCRRNCPSYQDKLKKRKNASVASTLGIFTIELYAFPNKTWVYDTGCCTHICNTSQGLRRSRKLKHRALSQYVGNGMRAVVEAIGCFDLVLPSGLIIVLDNCHFTPTRGVVLISCLVNSDYIHTFTNSGISILKDNVFYFNAIPHDGIYEIDMHNLYPNQNPDEIHWNVVKTILMYLRNTKDMVLMYGAKPEVELKVSCYANASFQTDKDDTKSQTGYVL